MTRLVWIRYVRPRDLSRVDVALEWKLQDLWIGAFWRTTEFGGDLWVCLLPCLPLHLSWSDAHARLPNRIES